MPEQAGRKEQDRPDEGEQRFHDRGHDSEGNREQPEEGPCKEKQECKRPAKDEEDGVKQEGDKHFQRGAKVDCH
jgi:hypothetical protein